jgi:hypothetical protein
VSLSRHLTSPSASHGRLAFHPDCPRCRAERLAGELGADRLAPLRTRAALAAGMLAFSAAAPPAVTMAAEPPQEQEGAADPGAEAPGHEAEFDPGGDNGFDGELAPPPAGQGGGTEDDGDGPPVEAEPLSDPDVGEIDTEAAPVAEQPIPPPHPPAAPPEPAAPAPVETPPPPAPLPMPAPAAPEAAAPEQAEGDKAPKKPDRRERQQRRPASPAPAPPAASPAPVVAEQSPAPAAQTTTVAVSQPEPEPAAAPAPSGRVAGPTYRVRAGDSLWSIARGVLGAQASNGQLAREVARLWRLNEQRIGTGDPSLLHIGTLLRLR